MLVPLDVVIIGLDLGVRKVPVETDRLAGAWNLPLLAMAASVSAVLLSESRQAQWLQVALWRV
jgi:hypothetical protein